MSAWFVDAPSWPVRRSAEPELTSEQVLAVLDQITPEVYADALASLAETEIPAETKETAA